MPIKNSTSSSLHPSIMSKGQHEVLGDYDFSTTIVSLYSSDSKGWVKVKKCLISLQDCISRKESMSHDVYDTLSKAIPLIFHEYTHFYDCSSTIWGAKYLSMMAQAYTADNLTHGGKEKDFHHAKKFHDLIRFSLLPKYYTDKTKITDDSRPWDYRESIGNRFSSSGEVADHPIVFTWFLNKNGEALVRSPISTISLLECAAMAQEINKNIGLISLLEKDQRTIELKLYTNKILDYIYNKDITEYSVCAHLVANKCKEPDVFLAYKVSAILCRLVLNTPSKIYLQIAEECDFESIFGSTQVASEYIEKVKKGLRYLEPGFLYYLICRAMSDGELNKLDEGFSLICASLQKLGVDYADLKDESRKEFLEYSEIAASSKIESISMIAKAGQRNYELNNWSNFKMDFHHLSLPPVRLNDFSQVDLFLAEANSLKSVCLTRIEEELSEGDTWVKRFVDACA
ncbi:hypothetical protein JCM18902_990 [Psychrobacter sp. JCM 18902]|uniref:hypothetical protein n=1 Tax=Psychrobacter sp. JCM 18902 TaxID=1298607 RepID=UPI0004317E7D|nr:hypothetical protein [Psychrobacter sp. JCM 18902]GAF58216.1 hypothetical protein JCM18902_990 [Psychrobacter sp. JCM 18902]